MTAKKREALKRSIKLKALAHLSGTTVNYLSMIINNNRSCGLDLAEKLAEKANMLQQETTFTPLDFMRND